MPSGPGQGPNIKHKKYKQLVLCERYTQTLYTRNSDKELRQRTQNKELRQRGPNIKYKQEISFSWTLNVILRILRLGIPPGLAGRPRQAFSAKNHVFLHVYKELDKELPAYSRHTPGIQRTRQRTQTKNSCCLLNSSLVLRFSYSSCFSFGIVR